MSLEIKGLQAVQDSLERYRLSQKNANKIGNRLANIAADEIRQAHSGVQAHDHFLPRNKFESEYKRPVTSDIKIKVQSIGSEHTVTATGENFLFFEFGAGVKHNSPRSWENVLAIPTPLGIEDIGGYGLGKGKQQSWIYSKDGMAFRTGGYKAVHGFANAINAIYFNIDDVIKEVSNG